MKMDYEVAVFNRITTSFGRLMWAHCSVPKRFSGTGGTVGDKAALLLLGKLFSRSQGALGVSNEALVR